MVHTFGSKAGAVQVVESSRVRFGRTPDNDVIFDPEFDRDASGHHAELRHEGEGWVLLDLGSRNGTFVASQRVTRRVLASGDEIAFGERGPRVRIELPADAPHAAAAAAAPPPAPPVAAGHAHGHAGAHDRHAHAAPSPVSPLAVSSGQVAPGLVAAARAFDATAPAAAPRAGAPHAGAPAFVPPAAQGHAPAGHAGPAPHGAAPAGPRPQPVPAAPPAGARVGQRTIAMMIQSAVAAATGRSRPRHTMEIAAIVDREVAQATAGQRRSSRTLLALLVVALLVAGGLVVWSTRSESEISRLRTDLAKLPPEDPRRKEIEGRLGTLHPSNANFGRNLYDKSRKAIFMLAGPQGGFCTAFAVRPNLLATNAHCVVAGKAMGRVTAVENEGRGQVSFTVSDMRPHPQYREADEKNITPDVGVVVIAGRAAAVVDIATPQELSAAGAGDDVYLIGFPGRLMDSTNPAATFMAANIGRITNAAGRPGAFGESWLVQHDASTTAGTSGSPIFNGKGKVIAINAGAYREGDSEVIAGRKTDVVKASPYKFGMRIDLLDPLLR